MGAFVRRFFKVYKDEVNVFLYCSLLLFLIRFGDVIFENYAETAFLKRFGVQYLPTIYMINAISTFLFLGIVASLQKRIRDLALITYISLFCGLSVVLIRIASPRGFVLIYPLFYLFKAQYEVILGLIFWNIANDIFNTRQSKRIFPLITAGGTVGSIAGSFLTPVFSKTLSFESLIWIYLIIMCLSASLGYYMDKAVAIVPYSETPKTQSPKSKFRVIDDTKEVIRISRNYLIVKILILITLIPNMIIPILNYVFNFTADKQFATESSILSFFSYFKGIMNLLSLFTLLFVGRLYDRFGLPVALLIHPANYLISFLGLFINMDAVMASYARISTTIIRNTINNPARSALMGILPREGRALLRAFLRGMVVRVGIMTGSGLIYLVDLLFGSGYISIAGATLAGLWVVAGVLLKARYPQILAKSVLEGLIDYKSMQPKDINTIFRDPAGRERLMRAFMASNGEDRVWYGKVLKAIGEPRLTQAILPLLRQEPNHVKKELISLLDENAGRDALPIFEGLLREADEGLLKAMARKAMEFPEETGVLFGKKVFEGLTPPQKRAYGIWLLYPTARFYYRDLILSWIFSEDRALIMGGLVAASGTLDREFLPYIREVVQRTDDPELKARAIEAISDLGADDINPFIYPYLSSPVDTIRIAALNALKINDPDSLRAAIRMLMDSNAKIRALALSKIRGTEYQDPSVILEGLSLTTRQAKEAMFQLLEEIEVKNVQIFNHALEKLREVYQCILDARAVEGLQKTPAAEMLKLHLEERNKALLKDLIRVLATQSRNKDFKTAWKALYSPNPVVKGNAQELLDSVLDRKLKGLLMPLIEGADPEETRGIATRRLGLRSWEGDGAGLLKRLLSSQNWVTVGLSMELLREDGLSSELKDYVTGLWGSPNICLRELARRFLSGNQLEIRECGMEEGVTLAEKIVRLRSIYLFQDLTVQELAAIATACKEVEYQTGTVVFKEGEKGDSLYLVTRGKVAVVKAMGEEGSPDGITLAEIGPGDYFGEMALIEDTVRSATIKTLEPSLFLVLEKHEFGELILEYPTIPLNICKVLSGRLRALQKKLTGQVQDT